jgi:hypothetical protein
MTCFFDSAHAPGSVSVMWSPQWGVPRPVQACGPCAQRVQTTSPPYYQPQAGYPQAGYPQQSGYPQPGYPQPGYPQQRPGHSTAAVVGTGVAGLVGGALIGEMLEEERPHTIIENNYYEETDVYEDVVVDDDGGFF